MTMTTTLEQQPIGSDEALKRVKTLTANSADLLKQWLDKAPTVTVGVWKRSSLYNGERQWRPETRKLALALTGAHENDWHTTRPVENRLDRLVVALLKRELLVLVEKGDGTRATSDQWAPHPALIAETGGAALAAKVMAEQERASKRAAQDAAYTRAAQPMLERMGKRRNEWYTLTRKWAELYEQVCYPEQIGAVQAEVAFLLGQAMALRQGQANDLAAVKRAWVEAHGGSYDNLPVGMWDHFKLPGQEGVV